VNSLWGEHRAQATAAGKSSMSYPSKQAVCRSFRKVMCLLGPDFGTKLGARICISIEPSANACENEDESVLLSVTTSE
jgi:hypothetical protein